MQTQSIIITTWNNYFSLTDRKRQALLNNIACIVKEDFCLYFKLYVSYNITEEDVVKHDMDVLMRTEAIK